MPIALTSDMPEAERRKWKIVRRDRMTELCGLALEANADTGHAVMREPRHGVLNNQPAHEDVIYDLGSCGIAILARVLLVALFVGLLSACAGLTGNIAPPVQPSPTSINGTVQALAAISADPVTAWQAGDYAVRSACDAYLNDLAQRQANFGLANGAIGTSGLAAAGFAAARANLIAAALSTSASTLVQTFLGQLQNAGALPYSAETTALIQNALDAYEGAVRPPTSLAQAASDAEGAWWLCSPAGYAELATKSIGSAQVSASAMPTTAAMTPTSPSRPKIFVNGR